MRPHIMWGLATLLFGCGTAPEATSVPTSQEQESTEPANDKDHRQREDVDLPNCDCPPTKKKTTAAPDDQEELDEDPSNTSESNDNVWYVPGPVSWQAAKSKVPRGYHLPSRAELIAAVDAGWFLDSGVSVGSVWSTTTVSGTPEWAWRVNLTDGYLDGVDKISSMSVVYLRNRN